MWSRDMDKHINYLVVINGPSRNEGVWRLPQTSRSPGDEILQDSTGINFPHERPHLVKGILFASCFYPIN